MTREHKLALVVGFSLVLVVGVLISDHFSKARSARVLDANNTDPVAVAGVLPAVLVSTADASDLQPLPSPPPLTLPGPASEPLLGGRHEPEIINMAATAQTTRPVLIADAGGSDRTPGSLGISSLQPAVRVDTLQVNGEAPEPVPALKFSGLPVSTGSLRRHEVVKGDTLSVISEKYYSEKGLWKQLMAYNKGRVGSEGSLRIGVTLLIPPREVLLGTAQLPPEAKADQPASPTPTTEKPQKPSKPTSGTLYVVQAGDTLARIADRQLGSKSRWENIRDLNADLIDDADSLSIGMKLKLPAR
ncbi:MAG: LysM peptidoglycan-binding domain-containing protein [Phycisphaeraceae bacterium]|nr:LysM peptidoglycan-binding domain-containing protein [Phycisphaeraceae bacterium]